jgi:sulfur relay (sulfurtransferase) DsrF/TusC family protein
LPSREGSRSIAVIVRRGPERAADVEEALRVALGQTLAAGRVTVAFVGGGVWVAAARPQAQAVDLEKHVAMLAELGHELVAEAAALGRQGIEAVRTEVAVQSRDVILARLARADVILAL